MSRPAPDPDGNVEWNREGATVARVTFEIPAHDRERARRFYESVFQWQATDLPDVSFTLLSAPSEDGSSQDEVEIIGGLANQTPLVKAPVPIITVSSIEDTCQAVVQAGGGRITQRERVGDYGYSAYVQDSEGNVLCLWENP
jgi:predicted enzyme related to lactoylglutathione lyase